MKKKLRLKKIVSYDELGKEFNQGYASGFFGFFLMAILTWLVLINLVYSIEPYHGWYLIGIPTAVSLLLLIIFKLADREITYEEIK